MLEMLNRENDTDDSMLDYQQRVLDLVCEQHAAERGPGSKNETLTSEQAVSSSLVEPIS